MNTLKNTLKKSLMIGGVVMATGIMGSQAFAEDHHHGHSDILLGIKDGQMIAMVEHGGVIEKLVAMGAEMPESYYATNPGFGVEADEYDDGITAPLASTDVSFDFNAFELGGTVSNLFYWDASDVNDIAFDAVNDGTMFTAARQISPFETYTATVNGGTDDVDGFVIGQTGADSGLHQHIGFYMLDEANGTDNIKDGIYAVAMSFSQEGLTASDPGVLVFAVGEHGEALHEAAVAFIEGAMVPEPASLALLGLGGLAAIGRRRQK
ncbi:PEP-CTERM motif protein [Poriferisphaera corsica]|uniref:PEP-CTERM motif protein n=1 Tax=Poriferisphaera corsica TaxID=2528020 RepID=A0A517YPH6_9BACT|nr:PEP-CTERM sorting domain-containing protein [Poriferisphaera corsica]QDU32123.1 PEP-CTERM motif protein [Poriferisphaera corsica]